MSEKVILAIDQGTSSTKSLIFSPNGKVLARGSAPLTSCYPKPGYVEQKPDEIYGNVIDSLRLCLEDYKNMGGNPDDIETCGISNQRETMVVWNRKGEPLYNAIVWQCKRSIGICERLAKEGLEKEINRRTGLIIDPYFSGTKMIWLYEQEEEIKKAVDGGDAYFGTVDCWLLYRLTKGEKYYTDYTNASRTLFLNLESLEWDRSLMEKFGLAGLNLPEPKPSSFLFGTSDFNGLLDKKIPITGMIGDSHAAAFGEGCYEKGTAKATLGTGSSILLNTGEKPVYSQKGMVTTICWSITERVDYALEGIIVTCGATIEWLKNQLGLFADSKETEQMAATVENNNGVYLVPAFSGLGAPHWKMDARAVISGLTLGCNKNHLVRAALESIPYQIKDVIAAMEEESGQPLRELKIDGGISANRFVVQYLTDLLNTKVVNIGMADVSGLGAALIAATGIGIYSSPEQIRIDQSEIKSFTPGKDLRFVDQSYEGWKETIQRIYLTD